MARGKSKKGRIFFVVILLFVIVAGIGGYFTAKSITANDTFEIIGDREITLYVGEDYHEEGAIAISFGQDISDKIKIEGTVDTQTEDTYYIKYTVDDIRYRGVERYRIVKVVASEVGNESV